MIRIVLYRTDSSKPFQKGALHGFQGTNAIVETLETGEMQLIPTAPENLKFEHPTKDWIEMQVRAQQEAQARQVVAPAGFSSNFGR